MENKTVEQSDLEEMLDSRRKQLASCERMLELLQPEWDRFEKRDGTHDTYVARDYAEHTSAARRHRKEISALEFALASQAPLLARIETLEAALEPFAQFAETNVDAEGWNLPVSVQNDRIRDWFGPSDFRAALNALGRKE